MAASAVRVAACHESSIPWSPDVARKWVNDGSLATLVGPVSTPPGPIGKICSSGSPPVEASHATTHSPVGRRAVTGGCWVAGSSSATLGEDIAVWSGATVDIVKRVLAPLVSIQKTVATVRGSYTPLVQTVLVTAPVLSSVGLRCEVRSSGEGVVSLQETFTHVICLLAQVSSTMHTVVPPARMLERSFLLSIFGDSFVMVRALSGCGMWNGQRLSGRRQLV